MMSTSTLGTGLRRLLNPAAALALLLLVAGGASAQSTIFVDANGGDDGNTGQQPTIGAGVNGPVETIQRALQLAGQDGAGNTISIEAGQYDADLTIQNTSSTATNYNNLTFLARPDQQGNTEVDLDVDGGEFLTAVTGFTFASQGGGTFSFVGGGDLDFQSGSVAFGSGIVSIDDIDVVEQTNAAVTGTVGYGAVPNIIRFNGDNSVAQSTLLPASLDIPSGTLVIDVALGSVASTINDNTRTLTLNGGLTLADDGGGITLRLRDGNVVAGTITVVDGSGSDLTGNVQIEGEGQVGDLVVSGGRLVFDLPEADVSDADADNFAASVTINSGEFVLPNEDPDADDLDRFRVTGDFVQNGGSVATGNPNDTILVVEGDFRRATNVAGNFSPLNLYLEGTADVEFAPGTNLILNSLHINATGNTATQVKMVTFLQDITVNSAATGTNGVNNVIPFIVTADAEVDLNGNLVNVNQGGESIVDGTVSDSDNSGAVRFTNGGVASGTGVYSSILVSGPSITAEGEFDFSGALILLQGGINVAADSDVSPVGPSAGVIVNIAAANPPQIMGAGTFNDDEREYDLTYQDSNSANGFQMFMADVEFDTDFIRNLTVNVTNATVSLPDGVVGDGSISGDVLVTNGETTSITGTQFATLQLNSQTITVLGSTTVEDNAIIDLLGDAIYRISTADNVLDGTIASSDLGGLGRLVLLDGSVISGTQTSTTGTSGATSESAIDARILLNEGATAELSMLRVINGDIEEGDFTSAAQGGTLTLGLVGDNDDDDDDLFNQELNGNVNGDVELMNSTLVLSTPVELTAEDEDIAIGTLDTQGNVFFVEGPDQLDLYSDVLGTGAVWPASDFLVINADNASSNGAPNQITIPVFHPGDENSDVTQVDANVLVTTTLRLTGVLDAEGTDVGGSSPVDYAVTLQGQDGNVPNLILDDGYDIDSDGTNEPENADDDEIIIDGPINLTTNEVGTVNVYTDLVVLATENVQTFTVTNSARLNAVDDPYTVMTFVVNGSLDLNTNELAVMGDVTINEDDAVFNSAGGGNRIVGESTINPSYSSLSFIGENDATLTVTPNSDSGVATFGDGVDLRIAKATSTTTVTLAGSPLVFDDDFSSGGVFDATRGGGAFDDETLVLEMGVFVVGDPSAPNDLYVRLDHTNRLTGSATSDAGQGFVFVPRTTQFPMAFVEGNVRKRIFSDPSLFAGDVTPGRVVYPVGVADEDDEGYAEFVLDFESIAQDQSFGLRNVTVSFVDEFAGGTLGLPIAGSTAVDEPANFYWLVRSNPSLGSGTFFNVEARYDGYELSSSTNDGSAATIDELTLIRRQFGDETTNPWTLVSETYDNFLLLDGPEDSDPVVIAQGAEAFLGPQGTLFTFGLTGGNRPVANEGEVPSEFALNGNQPNPFSARTAISFDLPEAADVTLEVYDVMGRRVVSINQGAMTAGADQRVELDGSGLASGVYVFRLNAVGASETWSRSGQITLAR